MPCSMRPGLAMAVALGLALLAGTLVEAQESLVTTSKELWTALSDPDVVTILMKDTVVVYANEWPGMVNVTRSVVVRPSPELLTAGVYATLDFNNNVMVVAIAAGRTLKFHGLEVLNAYGLIGPQFRFIRASVGATFELEDCVHRRHAGLPMEAAILNHASFARPPEDGSGPNKFYMLFNFTYASSARGAVMDPKSVRQVDFITIAALDTTSAFQGWYFGGFRYASFNSTYTIDHAVDDTCLKERTATECVAALNKQLEEEDQHLWRKPPSPPMVSSRFAPEGSTPAPSSGSRDSSTTKVVVAAVVPSCVMLLAVAVTAVLLLRRRGHCGGSQSATDTKEAPSDAEAPALGGGMPGMSKPGSSGVGSVDTGCVFLGLDLGQPLPEWPGDMAGGGSQASGKADEAFCKLTTARTEFPSDTQPNSGADGGEASPRRVLNSCEQQTHPHQRPLHQKVLPPQQPQMKPASVIAAARDPQISGRALMAGARGDAESNGDGAAGNSKPLSQLSGAESQGPDVMGELGAMARELRASVKDVAVRLEGVVGSGTFGVVFKGTWQGMPVAIKTVVFSASTEHRKRALHEAALCQSIVHPNIIATYCTELQPLGGQLGSRPSQEGHDPNDVSHGLDSNGSAMSQFQQDWRLYIIQEFADGGPLSSLYGNSAIWLAPGQVHLPSVVGLALGVARALVHLHSKRIIHGDLNPNNVLLKRDDGESSGYAVKVGDFGLSVMLPQHQSHLSNIRMGTMFYICPAVVLKAQVGPPSDIFSMGVIMWELYNGRVAGTQTAEGPRYNTSFPAFPPSCPAAYRNIAMGCLQKQPINRPNAVMVEQALSMMMC